MVDMRQLASDLSLDALATTVVPVTDTNFWPVTKWIKVSSVNVDFGVEKLHEAPVAPLTDRDLG